ncbi:MAG TPA: hypothetical protein VFZ65_08475 [Planctomycetota bacterium]|nr:hypothetical protein [Planctomycetota bacterium]
MRSPLARAPLPIVLLLLCAALLGLAAYALSEVGRRVDALARQAATNETVLRQVQAEVTRMRLEQSAGTQGPAALLMKLRTYAPMLVSARTTEPDYRSAQKEMQAILLAFGSIGEDAWAPIMERLGQLRGDKNFDEVKWLLEAAVRVDPKAGKALVHDVLLGQRLPSPRLRWYAARMLIDLDKQLAQAALRQIMRTESSRGINLDRAQAYGAAIPDQAAFATTGFNNFVQLYVLSEDPKIDETLLMVIGRSEHDPITIQECVEALGKRHCAAAVEAIQRLYKNPPLHQENPLFLVKCVDALHEIQGEGARSFLEEALRTTDTETVANHIKFLLSGQ